MQADPKSAEADTTSPASQETGVRTPPSSRMSWKLYAIVAAVIVVVAAALLVLVPPGSLHHGSGTTGTSNVVAPEGWSSNSLPYGQFAAVLFSTTQTEVMTGAFITTDTITCYVLNDSDFRHLAVNGTVIGYQYTTGQEWTGTINDTLPAGSWNLVFLDTLAGGTSGVAVTTAVVLNPT